MRSLPQGDGVRSDPLAPFEPSAADPFDLRKVSHLLRRAGFAASLTVRRRLARAGLGAAFAWLRAADALPGIGERIDDAIAFGTIDRVRAWRVAQALWSPRQLAARASYFWHGHFATSDQKLRDPRAMALQLATFDRLGLGCFDELAAAMCRDPALLRWLDNDVNSAQQPNENFARELFELFTLGRGHYTEIDIREAARAFTGWHVRDGRFRFAPHLHDDGDKQVFGSSGRLDGDDVVRLAVERPESATFLASKLLAFFVHPEPLPDEVAALARVYRQRGRDLGATVAALLQSRLFFSPRAYRSKIKAPADFAIGTVRLLGARAAPTLLARVMSALGETWCEPPSVEGWHGERAWLSPASWLLRSNFVADLLAGRRGKLRPGPEAVFDGVPRAERAEVALLVLLDGEVGDDSRDRIERLAASPRAFGRAEASELLHAVACLPEFQLL
ncbi:MAG: DUF1800 domain-containing protein [Planctomycetes bacterium]|nr:DUF1800 domain-containing protein [Planctomycetota bacterium]